MQKSISRIVYAAFIACVIMIPLALYAKNDVVTVSADEKIEGDFLRAGRIVRILAPVDGDVIVAGGMIEIAGPVTGDVIAVGGDIRIVSDVAGNVRAAGGSVEVSGTVGKNVLAAGNQVTIAETAEIGGSVTIAASDAVFRGRAGKGMRAWTENALIAGEVGGDLNLSASARDGVTLERTALIEGDFDYRARTAAVVRDGAVVKGRTEMKPLPEQDHRELALEIALGRLLRFFGLVAVGLVLLSLVPKALDTLSAEKTIWQWRMLGIGFLWTFLAPLAALILLFTIIGVPLALLLFALWAVVLYSSQVVIALFLGRVLFRHVFKSEERAPKLMDLAFGALLWVILTAIPYVGWAIGLLGVLLAMGSLVTFKKQELARYR